MWKCTRCREDNADRVALCLRCGTAKGVLVSTMAGTNPGSQPQPPGPLAAERSHGLSCAAPSGSEAAFILLRDGETGKSVGEVTADQLRSILRELGEDSWDPGATYYVDPSTLAALERTGADSKLTQMLRRGLGARDSMSLRCFAFGNPALEGRAALEPNPARGAHEEVGRVMIVLGQITLAVVIVAAVLGGSGGRDRRDLGLVLTLRLAFARWKSRPEWRFAGTRTGEEPSG